MATIVTVTKKGQATIPKKLREKHGIRRKVVVVDTEDGILLKPVQGPSAEKGSLRELFKDKTSKELVEEARQQEFKREGRLQKAVRSKR